jgi:hypothetical protein
LRAGGRKNFRTVTAVTFGLVRRPYLQIQKRGAHAMFEVYMLQPMTATCDLFATTRRRSLVPEPDLDELMQDPVTLAVMAADRVDHGALNALFARVRENLC